MNNIILRKLHSLNLVSTHFDWQENPKFQKNGCWNDSLMSDFIQYTDVRTLPVDTNPISNIAYNEIKTLSFIHIGSHFLLYTYCGLVEKIHLMVVFTKQFQKGFSNSKT